MKKMMNAKKCAMRAGTAISGLLLAAVLVFALPLSVRAETSESNQTSVEQEGEDNAAGQKAMAAALAIGLSAAAGAIGMGMAISKSAEGISRQPEAEGKIRTTLMLGLVFVETAIIYALIVAILIIFVL
ncbi:MAG: ATP synthase F0 subunit C [Roseburia sp.]|nr:ATP synthase F0 subunit C [Roseburia sp.]